MANLSTFPTTSSLISILDGDNYISSSDDDSVELDVTSLRVVTTRDKNKDNPEHIADAGAECENLSPKDKLRNKIQERRISTGVGELQVEFETPKEYPMTKEEKRKQECRRQRNRDSANRSRLKRKFKLDYLEEEVDKLKKENGKLIAEVSALKKVKATLAEKLDNHKCEATQEVASSEHSEQSGSSEWSKLSQMEKEKQIYNIDAFIKALKVVRGNDLFGSLNMN